MATEKLVISDKLKATALKGIGAFILGFQKQAKAFDNLSAHVLSIAKEAAAEAGDDLAKAADWFDAAAKYAQREYQKDHKEGDKIVPMELLCPAWAPRKSEVLRCMRKGVDPRDFEKVADMTRERVRIAEENKERGTQERREGPADGDADTTIELPSKVGKAMERFYKALGAASAIAEYTDAIAAQVEKWAGELEQLYLSKGESDGNAESEVDAEAVNE